MTRLLPRASALLLISVPLAWGSGPDPYSEAGSVDLDPVSRALANAPMDDEPVTEEKQRAVAEAREWFKHNQGIPFEQVVAELGFTMEEVENYRDPS